MAQNAQRNPLRTVLGILLVLAAVGAFAWAVWPDRGTPSGAPGALDPVTGDDWQRGKASSTVTLLEYADVQCPACAQFHPITNKLVELYGDRVNFVYRHFPLINIHANAQLGAQAAEAAGRQGKLFEMLDVLYSQQPSWSSLPSDQAREKFVQFAKDLKLDEKKFSADLESDEVRAAVDADRASGDRAGVTGTPTFFLNGSKVTSSPTTVEAFSKLLDDALAAAASAPEPAPSK